MTKTKTYDHGVTKYGTGSTDIKKINVTIELNGRQYDLITVVNVEWEVFGGEYDILDWNVETAYFLGMAIAPETIKSIFSDKRNETELNNKIWADC